MRYFLLAVLITIIPTSGLANDFGVSISIGQPGFYGQINLGDNYPRPQLIYPQPVLVREFRANIWEHQSPIYLHVPPGHAHNWHQHCHRYQACNQSVYFVRENWYNDVYAPQYNSYSNRHYDSNRRHNVDYQNRHYDSDHHDRGYQDRRYDSHRDRDDHDQGKHRNKREHRYGNDKHQGKR